MSLTASLWRNAHLITSPFPLYNVNILIIKRTGVASLAIRRGFYYGVPWRAATTAMLSENTQRAFYGRGVPRPYKALQKQGYRRDFTAFTGRTRIAIIHSKTSLSVIAGEACLARITIWIQCVPHWRARRASPLQSLAESRL